MALPEARPLRILLVEDHAALTQCLSRYLRTHGHGVSSAGDLRGARAELAEHEYDLLLADVHLPDGDCYGLMEGTNSVVPRFAVTMSGFETKVCGRAARRVRRHLVKPFAAEELDELLESLSEELSHAGEVIPVQQAASGFDEEVRNASRAIEGARVLPAMISAVLREAARLRANGRLSQAEFEEKLERLSREELATRGLQLSLQSGRRGVGGFSPVRGAHGQTFAHRRLSSLPRSGSIRCALSGCIGWCGKSCHWRGPGRQSILRRP